MPHPLQGATAAEQTAGATHRADMEQPGSHEPLRREADVAEARSFSTSSDNESPRPASTRTLEGRAEPSHPEPQPSQEAAESTTLRSALQRKVVAGSLSFLDAVRRREGVQSIIGRLSRTCRRLSEVLENLEEGNRDASPSRS